ncbi:MAG: class II aldolase/adducin family protein [Oscillibacter sp.]|jgi:L-fuculose-phosphate aldolase|nr:class II aldolase/adducin family protein [Oscillibacter sp.]
MNYKAYLVESGKRMLHKGLTVETWGNLSVQDPETGLVYLTPSAMPYDSISEDDVVVMREDGTLVEGTRKPTVECGMHLGILRSRPGIHAVIHTHPIYSLVFAVQHRDIPPIIDEAAQIFGGTVHTAEYALPGSAELAENVQKALGPNGMACLLANHGAVCLGKDMEQAFRVCTVLEMTAQVYQMALTTGTPQQISQQNVDYMKDFMEHHYGQGK